MSKNPPFELPVKKIPDSKEFAGDLRNKLTEMNLERLQVLEEAEKQ